MKLRSNEPFWMIKNGIIHSYPSLQANLKTDVVIIGAGITGSLIAHQCIADGYEVAIIDRREIGHGSTSATTAMLQYEIDIPLYRLIDQLGEKAAIKNYVACSDSIDTLQKITKEIKSKCGFEKKESLYFAAFKKDTNWLQKEYLVRKKHGLDVHWLDEDEIRQHYGMHRAYSGILSKQGGSIDAFRLTHDLLDYNSKRGLAVFDKTEIKEVEYSKDSVLIQTKTGFSLKANKLIYCNGFESTEIIKEKFVDLLSTYALVSEQSDLNLGRLDRTLFWNTADPYHYMRTTSDHRVLIGGGDEEFVNTKKRDALIGQKTRKLHQYLEKILPEQKFITDFAWAGTFGETKDGLPFIGRHPDFESTYFVLGFGGNGITFSVIGMQLISDFLKGKEHELAQYYQFGR